MNIDLNQYDLVILNSSGGKDSLCALWEMSRLRKEQNYPIEKIVVSHQDLGQMEWPGTKQLVELQAKYFGFKTYYSKRRNKAGYEETLLEYVLRRGKWPSNKQRFCTSDYKRGPGARVVTFLTKSLKNSKVLYVFGFRKVESPSRLKKEVLKVNQNLTTKSRIIHDYLPIHDWDNERSGKLLNQIIYHIILRMI